MASLDSSLRPTLRTLVRRWRGLLVLHRRWLVALAVAASVLAGLRAVSPAPPPTVGLVVADQDLPGGHALTPADLTVRRVPSELAPRGAAGSPTSLTGRTLASPVRAGEVLTDRRLLGPALLAAHPGTVAVPVRLPDPGLRGLLRVGDRVDLVAAGRAGGAVVLTADAPVLTLPRAARSGPTATGVLVVLAVPEAEALDVVRASAAGVVGVMLG